MEALRNFRTTIRSNIQNNFKLYLIILGVICAVISITMMTKYIVLAPAINLNKQNQKLTIEGYEDNKITKTFGDTPFAINITSNKTKTNFSYESSVPTVAIYQNGKIKIIGAGTTTLKITENGDNDWNPSTVILTLVVQKYQQTLSFTNSVIKTITYLSNDTITKYIQTSISPLQLNPSYTFESVDGGITSITADGSVTAKKVGTASIKITEAGSNNWTPASITLNFSVTPKQRIMQFKNPSDLDITKTYGDSEFELEFTDNNQNPVYEYKSSDSAVATIAAHETDIRKVVIKIISSSTSNITLTIVPKPDDNWMATQLQTSLKINKAKQTITISKPTDVSNNKLIRIFTNTSSSDKFELKAQSSLSNANISYVSDDPTTASITSTNNVNTVEMKKVGSCNITIKATTSNDNYETATLPIFLKIEPQIQIITATKTVWDVYDTESVSLGVSSNKPNAKFTYSSSNSDVVSVDGNGKVTIKTKGSAVITVSENGGDGWNATKLGIVINVYSQSENKTIQTFSNIDEQITAKFGSIGLKLNPSTNKPNPAFTYLSMDTTIATMNQTGGLITILNDGIVCLTITEQGNSMFYPRTAIVTLSIEPIPQILSTSPSSINAVVDDIFNVTSKFSISNNRVNTPTYKYSTSDATILKSGTSPGSFEALKVGSVYIYVDAEGGTGYTSTRISVPITISRKTQILTLGNNTSPTMTKTYGDGTFTISATSNAGSSVQFKYVSTNTSIATISTSGLVTIVNAGSTSLKIFTEDTDKYGYAEIFVSLTVSKGDQNLKITTPQITNNKLDKNINETPFDITTSSNNTSVSYTYSTGNSSIATISSANASNTHTVKINGQGSTKLTIIASSTNNWNGDFVEVQLEVSKLSPQLQFTGNSLITAGQTTTITYGDTLNFSVSSLITTNATYTFQSYNTEVATIAPGNTNSSATITTLKGSTNAVRIEAKVNGTSQYNDETIYFNLIVREKEQNFALTNGTDSTITKTLNDTSFSIYTKTDYADASYSYESSSQIQITKGVKNGTTQAHNVSLVGTEPFTDTIKIKSLGAGKFRDEQISIPLTYDRQQQTFNITSFAPTPLTDSTSTTTVYTVYVDDEYDITTTNNFDGAQYSYLTDNSDVAIIQKDTVVPSKYKIKIIGSSTSVVNLTLVSKDTSSKPKWKDAEINLKMICKKITPIIKFDNFTLGTSRAFTPKISLTSNGTAISTNITITFSVSDADASKIVIDNTLLKGVNANDQFSVRATTSSTPKYESVSAVATATVRKGVENPSSQVKPNPIILSYNEFDLDTNTTIDLGILCRPEPSQNNGINLGIIIEDQYKNIITIDPSKENSIIIKGIGKAPFSYYNKENDFYLQSETQTANYIEVIGEPRASMVTSSLIGFVVFTFTLIALWNYSGYRRSREIQHIINKGQTEKGDAINIKLGEIKEFLKEMDGLISKNMDKPTLFNFIDLSRVANKTRDFVEEQYIISKFQGYEYALNNDTVKAFIEMVKKDKTWN